jgi:hypothetical protein
MDPLPSGHSRARLIVMLWDISSLRHVMGGYCSDRRWTPLRSGGVRAVVTLRVIAAGNQLTAKAGLSRGACGLAT